jgi:hypothetical protein
MESLTSIPKRLARLFSEEACRFIFERQFKFHSSNKHWLCQHGPLLLALPVVAVLLSSDGHSWCQHCPSLLHSRAAVAMGTVVICSSDTHILLELRHGQTNDASWNATTAEPLTLLGFKSEGFSPKHRNGKCEHVVIRQFRNLRAHGFSNKCSSALPLVIPRGLFLGRLTLSKQSLTVPGPTLSK